MLTVSSFVFRLERTNRKVEPTAKIKAAMPSPQSVSQQTTAAIVEAQSAVMNQPLITVSTPEMRYTAVSRSQAPSAKLEPIATMKVT